MKVFQASTAHEVVDLVPPGRPWIALLLVLVLAVEFAPGLAHSVDFDVVTGRGDAFDLPGVRSPNGLRSVHLGSPHGATTYPPQDIWLHEVGAEPRRLGDGFGARMHILSSSVPSAPLMWLDDDRVLTQRTTGVLVVLRLDGSVEPLCRVPTVTGHRFGPLDDGDTGGWLERSPEGGIVYSMVYFDPDERKLRSHRFLIDPEQGTWRSCHPD